ncbi:TerC/Alx family metal homeostasis membrane protein [Echinicola jeungdonensis]|uniref:TerC/Alx family metal homeostasis membrane protein n=1 Tax=Echinicola jeungdonensis TaxID=709343 RepID=A0ABV5J0C4_9BACT|nr:TerC/Alx family metal homeostasis membrane protein [Echinicola jeungdonensis]MDN3671116.1 TerC/Alx family metal homeostasis membrane protein [Echinicola jeungdonensis]
MEYLQKEGFTIIGFIIIILSLLLADLFLFNRKAHKVQVKEALFWSAVWIGFGLLFGVYIYLDLGSEKASQYYTAFLIEKALSVDNLFVFIMVFRFFKVPDIYQHKVLFYGILGAIFMRAIFIFFGVTLIEYSYLPAFEFAGQRIHINLVMTLFGAFLVYAGWKSWQEEDEEQKDYSNSIGTKIIHRLFRVSPEFHKDRFFVKIHGKRWATQLLVVVAVIEFTDLLFAVDSIPAIFAVSNDPIILYTSNIFAILGLRALYFLLANAFDMFQYLKYGLAIILVFIGAKMVLSSFLHISSLYSLSVVIGILFCSMMLSINKYRLQKASEN